MTDLELLFLVLAVVYGWECACWLPRGSVGFVTWQGRRWRLKHPGALVGNQRGGFVFASPLPPLGTVFTAHQFPLSISSEVMLGFVAANIGPGARPQQTGRLVRFTELRTVEVSGRKLLVNGEVFLKAATPTFTEDLARQVRELMKLPNEERPRLIEQFVKAAFDTKSLEGRWQEFRKRTSHVRLLTNFLFGYLFGFAPVLIWSVGLSQSWLELLIGLFLFTLATALFFRAAHKRFYPAAEDERFTHFVTILLSPATAIRARDVLSRALLETFHPLAIAKVFCEEPEFRSFARRVLIELRHPALPVCPRDEQVAQSAEANYRAIVQKAVEKFLKQSKVDVEELTRPIAPADETCKSFCPRCEAQFTTIDGKCADCGGLPLVPFSAVDAHVRSSKA